MASQRELMSAALEHDGAGQRAILTGDRESAQVEFRAAAECYRASWELASATSYGRLVGMLKTAILAGDASQEADYLRTQLGDDGADSPTASYAQALGALIRGDDLQARRWASHMRGGSEAFDRTAAAIEALSAGDQPAYAVALESIVRDFEERSEHLTGVAIADTALVLEVLADGRGMRAGLQSPVLPQLA
jgi:hypothetical protein